MKSAKKLQTPSIRQVDLCKAATCALANLAEVDFFIKEEAIKAKRRPEVLRNAEMRLSQLATALGERTYFVGDDFTIADMMIASVLKIVGHTTVLEGFPNLEAFRDRCFARPGYQKAVADQLAEIAQYAPRDTKYDQTRQIQRADGE